VNQQNKRLWVVAALTSFASWAHAGLVFAVNEGVTYRVPNSEIRGHYAAIAADLSKILKQPVTIKVSRFAATEHQPRQRRLFTEEAMSSW
jgi:hypothetical protein